MKILIALLKPLSFLPAIFMMLVIYTFSAQTGEVSGELSYQISYQIVETNFAGMTLCMGTRYLYDWTWMRVQSIGLGTVFLITLLVGIAYLHRTFFRPMNNLVNVMDAIGRGERPSLELPNNSREFTKVSDTFRDMLTTLEEQKIAVYEKEIKAQKMETNALRLQIRRHFFLNCLKNNTLSSLTLERSRRSHLVPKQIKKDEVNPSFFIYPGCDSNA